ncbi:MAG: DUF3568 family protein [Candidatus Omnitrophota bacterium]
MVTEMRKRLLPAVVVLLALSLSGCWPLIFGTLAAAGGYAVSRDTIQGETEKDFDDVWHAAMAVVPVMGSVVSESYELGHIEAIVNGARVKVDVLQMTSSIVRLKVKARKNIFQSLVNAQQVFIKIMNKVNGED